MITFFEGGVGGEGGLKRCIMGFAQVENEWFSSKPCFEREAIANSKVVYLRVHSFTFLIFSTCQFVF